MHLYLIHTSSTVKCAALHGHSVCGQYIYIETTSEFLINFLLTGFPASFDFLGGGGEGGGNVEQMILNSNENIRTQKFSLTQS